MTQIGDSIAMWPLPLVPAFGRPSSSTGGLAPEADHVCHEGQYQAKLRNQLNYDGQAKLKDPLNYDGRVRMTDHERHVGQAKLQDPLNSDGRARVTDRECHGGQETWPDQ